MWSRARFNENPLEPYKSLVQSQRHGVSRTFAGSDQEQPYPINNTRRSHARLGQTHLKCGAGRFGRIKLGKISKQTDCRRIGYDTAIRGIVFIPCATGERLTKSSSRTRAHARVGGFRRGKNGRHSGAIRSFFISSAKITRCAQRTAAVAIENKMGPSKFSSSQRPLHDVAAPLGVAAKSERDCQSCTHVLMRLGIIQSVIQPIPFSYRVRRNALLTRGRH